jgi:hypothetical protein
MVPLEVGTRLVEAIPAVVDKAPSAVERVRRELVLARFIGKMAVDQGVREVRSRLLPSGDEPGSASPTSPSEPSEGDVAGDTAAPPVAPQEVPDVDTLALSGYDHLSSAQIVAKLDGLDVAERRSIERYERAGRHRRTILGKLERLEADG